MVGISIAIVVGRGVLRTVPHELRRLASMIRRFSRMLESRNWYQDVGATHASPLHESRIRSLDTCDASTTTWKWNRNLGVKHMRRPYNYMGHVK